MLIRSIVASRSEEDVRAGDALVQQIRIYPLSQAGNPPKLRFVDMTDKLYNAVVPYDDSFYESLARVINEEPVQSRDLEMMGMLLPLGIEKSKEFNPDPATPHPVESGSCGSTGLVDSGDNLDMPALLARQQMEHSRSANRYKDRISMGSPQLLRRGRARDHSCQLLRASGKARRG